MTPADWVASGIAFVALVLSGYSIARQRASSMPHWEFDWTSQAGQYPGSEFWRAEVRQAGPGDVERVSIASRVRGLPGSVWEGWDPHDGQNGVKPVPAPRPVMHSEGFSDWDFGRVMRRGEYAWHTAKITNNGSSYVVEVKIEWVQSPNTHRQRSHVESHAFGRSGS
ncbi:hypothetical protein [Leifsonia poae]|uniref:hypothetical protein n=1 Tax=Leifsonia poae TaxID=110933 RepID=UPI003D67083F